MKPLAFPEPDIRSPMGGPGLAAEQAALAESFIFRIQPGGLLSAQSGPVLAAAVEAGPARETDARLAIATTDDAAVDGVSPSGAITPDIAGAGPEVGLPDGAPMETVRQGDWTDDELFDELGNWFYLSPTFTDLDGDGDMDMVVGMWQGGVVALRNGTEHTSGPFQNWDGEDPFAAVDVETMATPAMTDLEGDGDMDLVVANGVGEISVFRNGTILTEGAYTEQAGTYPFTYFQGKAGLDVAFVDLDGDGDDDMVAGDGTGALVSYRNGTDGGRGNYVLWGEDDPFRNVSVDGGSTPAFIDMDADGDLDCVSGTREGSFVVFRNGGFGTSGDFREWQTADPFEGVGVSLRSDPAFADIDGDGDLDFITGSYDFNLYAYENTAWPGTRPKFDFDGALMQIDVEALLL